MKLIYTRTTTHQTLGEEVQVGDTIKTSRGEIATVERIRAPHKPSSTGRVAIRYVDGKSAGKRGEFFPSVIGAQWVDREDQA